MSYQSYATTVSSAQIKGRLNEAPTDTAGVIIQILGWIIIGVAIVVGIVFMTQGSSNTFDTGTDTTGAAVGAGIGIILGGIFYGAIFIGFGRVVVYVRKTAYILASTAIVGEAAGGFAQAVQSAAPMPVQSGGGWQPTPTPTPTPAPAPFPATAPLTSTVPVSSAPEPAPYPEPAPTPAPVADVDPTPPVPAVAEPGWVADPTSRHELRYWDGTRYTENVADQGRSAIDPM